MTKGELISKAVEHYKNGDFKLLGICHLLCYTANSWKDNIILSFPELGNGSCKQFGGSDGFSYYWIPGEWDTGREDFLYWLYDKYKDDDTIVF